MELVARIVGKGAEEQDMGLPVEVMRLGSSESAWAVFFQEPRAAGVMKTRLKRGCIETPRRHAQAILHALTNTYTISEKRDRGAVGDNKTSTAPSSSVCRTHLAADSGQQAGRQLHEAVRRRQRRLDLVRQQVRHQSLDQRAWGAGAVAVVPNSMERVMLLLKSELKRVEGAVWECVCGGGRLGHRARAGWCLF